MFEIFIRRPILSGVISVVIVFLGLLAITSLPITQFPDIVPPSVTVTARYTGANADVMAKTVATPLERAINGVPGMTYMTTVCTNDGMSLTTIYFKVGTDPDVASVNVQNRVTTVLDELPEEVIRAGVITEKEVNSMLMYLNIMSTDSSHTEKFVYNFADINILRELKRIDGVGFVEIMGSRDYAMRVWLNPNRLAAYNMSPQEVTAAIRSQNIEAAPGKTGISSDKIPQQLQYVLQYSGKFSTPEEYGEIVLKALPDGSVLRLKDVATIEFDSEDYNMISMTDGKPSASIMIKQRPGSNAREVIQNIKAKMEEIKESSFAPGMDYKYIVRCFAISGCFDFGCAPDVVGSLFAGVYRGIFVPAGFPFDVDSGDSRSCFACRDFLFYADVGFLHQYADTVRTGAGNRYRGR